jgi:tetratricopeptide (TPR) repeat protein
MPDTKESAVNTQPANDGRATGSRKARLRRRRALYAATMLAPLGGVALALAARGLLPVLTVQEAIAQSISGGDQPAAPPLPTASPLSALPAATPAPAPDPTQPLPPADVTTAPPATVRPPPAAAAIPPPAAPLAATPAPVATDAATGAALGVLLEQAKYWQGQHRDDQAIVSLDRALKLAPTSIDALALMAEVQSDMGDEQAAAVTLEKLKRLAPGDARILKIEQAIRVGPISPEQLSEARRLAQAGKQTEAVAGYNRVLKGNPPPDDLAVEYYQTLAGSEGGYDQARDALAHLVRQNPQDLKAQLAYAEVLTYRAAGRLEGIQRLASLAQIPAIADQATPAWRQALGWLPDTKEAIDPLQTYVATHPEDSELNSKLELAKNPLLGASPLVRTRIAGFDALTKNHLAEAETAFQRVVDSDPTDADATGGLGIVKLRQHKQAEAKILLARAIALDPQHKDRWAQALTAASNPGGGPNPATALINAGDYSAAERELRRQIAAGGDTSGLQAMLADAQARSGKLDDAEATYRAALTRAPNNAQLLSGLAGVLSRQGRTQEASDVLQRAQSLSGNARQVAQTRATQLREQANAVADPVTQAGLYRAALASDPNNPWIRLDLARALTKLGQRQEARDVMQQVLGAAPTTDALKAGIIFANENNDPDTAAALIARLPPGMRTADMRASQIQADMQRQIDAALAYSPAVARERLLTMAAMPDPDGVRGAALARALGGIGDKLAAREAVVAAQASTPHQRAGAKLRYAGALLEIGDAPGASDLLAQLGGGRGLTGAERQSYVQLQAGLAVRTSDKLNEQGRQADAYDHLAPLLAQAPENPDLNLALARLYQGAKNPKEALQISEALLRRDPNNIEARKGAVEAALQLGDRRRADQLVQEGLQLAPNDPKTWMMSASLEKSRGNNAHALRDLERARDLRLQQLGYSGGGADAGADTAPSVGVSLVPGAPPTYRPMSQPAYHAPLPNADGGADMGAVPPVDLSAPPQIQRPPAPPPDPAPPFVPQPTTALGTPPSYQPPGSYAAALPPPHRLVPAAFTDESPTGDGGPLPLRGEDIGADQMNALELGRERALDDRRYPRATRPMTAPEQAGAPDYGQDNLPALRAAPAYATPQYPLYQAPVAPPPPTMMRRPMAQYQPIPAAAAPGYYANPFRQTGDNLGSVDGVAPGPRPIPDAETEEIDRDILALRDTVAPSVQAGFGIRTRSGDAGLDKLEEFTVPMEATYSPGGTGTLKLAVTPTILTSGTLGGSASNQQRFGTQALSLVPGANNSSTLSTAGQGDQNATGLGLDVGYNFGSVAADVGSTPFGFRKENIIGGVEWAPQLSDNVRLRLRAERRAATDSILSYAGTVDTRTGQTWGGVVQNHGRATLEMSSGKANFYLLGGGAQYTGTHVESNTEFEAGAGGSYPVYHTDTQEVRVGLDLIYFGYSHNLRFFTLGQGGYFSPQSFTAAMIPVTYKEQVDEDLSYQIGGSAGYSSFHENASPYYPLDSGLQAQLVAQQAGTGAVSGVQTEYPSRSQAGFAGTAHAQVEYRISPSLHLGGQVDFEHSTNFDQTTGLVYAKYVFNGADK